MHNITWVGGIIFQRMEGACCSLLLALSQLMRGQCIYCAALMMLLLLESAGSMQRSGSKKAEAMLLLLEQAEVTLHGGHGAMSDGGLE